MQLLGTPPDKVGDKQQALGHFTSYFLAALSACCLSLWLSVYHFNFLSPVCPFCFLSFLLPVSPFCFLVALSASCLLFLLPVSPFYFLSALSASCLPFMLPFCPFCLLSALSASPLPFLLPVSLLVDRLMQHLLPASEIQHSCWQDFLAMMNCEPFDT